VIAFSNAQKVELFLNDASLGVQDVPHDGFAEWQVPYAAGRLVAKGYTDGKTVATEELATTGPAARIKFGSAQTTLTANGEDAVIVPVSIVDAQGRVVPGAANEVAFQLVGGGRIVGTGNGDPADHDPERAYQGKAFHGRCVVIVQAGVEPGRLELTATSQGLEPVSAAVTVR
jgi:beta-galactosidase